MACGMINFFTDCENIENSRFLVILNQTQISPHMSESVKTNEKVLQHMSQSVKVTRSREPTVNRTPQSTHTIITK